MDNKELLAMQVLPPSFEVAVQVLAEEGTTYVHFRNENVWNPPDTVIGKIPKGMSYIEISSAKSDLIDFWDAVSAAKKTFSNPDNLMSPAKI